MVPAQPIARATRAPASVSRWSTCLNRDGRVFACQSAPCRSEKPSLLIQRESAAQNLCQSGAVDPYQFTKAVHNLILCQYRQFVNANRRGCIETGLAPLLDRDIKVGNPKAGGDGSANEIVVCRVKQDHGWA